MYPLYINIENTNRLSVFSFFVHLLRPRWRKNFIVHTEIPRFIPSCFSVVPSSEFSLRDAMILEVSMHSIRRYKILFCGPLNWTVEKIHFHTFHKQMQSEVKIPCCDFLTFTTHRSFLEQVVICKEMAFLQIPRFPRATSMDILSEACWYLPWTSSCVNAEEY